MSKEQKKGYIIFNADGSQPKATLAALDDPRFTQVIIEGTPASMIKLFGAIAEGLHDKAEIPKEILHSTIDAAIASGDAWGSIMSAMSIFAKAKKEEGKTEEEARQEFDELWEEITGDAE